MAKIYLIRHAESIANTKGIYQGQSYDTKLSQLGEKQADALGRRFANIPLDRVYSSPLTRAIQTAKAILKHQHTTIPFTLQKEIIETNHGEWEGIHKSEIQSHWPREYRRWQEHPSAVRFPKGERFADTARRARMWIQDICKKNETVAVVTHGNIIQIFLTYFYRLPLNEIWKFDIQSASVTIISAQKVKRVIQENNSDHLVGLVSDLSKQAV